MVSRIRRPLEQEQDRRLALAGLAHLPAFPPLRVAPIPFVARAWEQEEGLRLLTQRRVLAITGGVGSGKTALAATIAQQTDLPAYWIEVPHGAPASVETFLWQLARPLAEQAPAVWRTLHRIVQSKWDYPVLVRLQMILAAYAQSRHESLVCISDVEWWNDRTLEAMLVGLCDYVAGTHHAQLKLVIEGTRLPYNIHMYGLPSLKGLSIDAIQVWAQHLSIPLQQPEATSIFRQTEGLPKAIKLLFDAMLRSPMAHTLDHIMEYREIRWFVQNLLSTLQPDEQALLALSASPSNEQRSLSPAVVPSMVSLEKQHLIIITTDHIQVHPLIQNYYRYYSAAA